MEYRGYDVERLNLVFRITNRLKNEQAWTPDEVYKIVWDEYEKHTMEMIDACLNAETKKVRRPIRR